MKYIVKTVRTSGGHTKSTETDFRIFDTKDELARYLVGRPTYEKIDVYEARKMNFSTSVELTPVEGAVGQ